MYLTFTPVSRMLALAFVKSLLNVDLFHFYLEVGDLVDADYSGFSVPLEHSFEVGENLFLLLVIALKLTAAANDEDKWKNRKHTSPKNQSVLRRSAVIHVFHTHDAFSFIWVTYKTKRCV